MIHFYIVDTETTGLNSLYNEVMEISIIRCKDRVQLTELIKCDFPERANLDALEITKRTISDLSKGKSKEQVINKINKFLNEDNSIPNARCFIAHNYSFDKKFIHALYEKVNQYCPIDLWLCTMALTKEYAKKNNIIKPKVNLHAACDLVNIKKYATAHDATFDTRNTFFLWQKLINDHQIDYLPFIKNFPHKTPTSENSNAFDVSEIE